MRRCGTPKRMMMQGSPRIDELRQKFHENPRRYFAPLANEYRKAGDPEQAIAICRAHLAQQPGHMSGHVVYGQALYDAKRPDEARVVFEKALTLDPDNAIVLRQLGDIAREKGDNAEAKHWYTRALDADPGDREVAAYIAELTEPITAEAAPETAPPQEPVAAETPEEIPAEPETIPETGMPAEPVAEVSAEEDKAPEPEVAAAPRPEESPFVTRTMAELYAKQGYKSAALDVYRQLALHHPDDAEIQERIRELSHEPVAETAATPAAEPEAIAEPIDHPIDEPVAEVESTEPEPAAQSDSVAELAPEQPQEEVPPAAEPEITDDDFAFQELDNEIVFAPTDEDLNLVTELKPPQPEKHFTETDLGGQGDSWDADSWAARRRRRQGLVELVDSPEQRAEISETAAEREAEPVAQAEPVEPTEPVEQTESVAQAETALDEAGAEPTPVAEAEPVAEAQEVPTEAVAEEVENVAAAGPAAEPVPAQEQEQEQEQEQAWQPESEPIVAYSPELPEEEELPHYAPKGPTVREFFATLGSKRPSTSNSITARAAVPEIRSQPQPSESDTADLPLATDAFANMFANEPVNEDDARAAFALSGAIAASETPLSRTPTPPKPAPAQQEPPAVPATTEESEEDIRRFREWLDGLSES